MPVPNRSGSLLGYIAALSGTFLAMTLIGGIDWHWLVFIPIVVVTVRLSTRA